MKCEKCGKTYYTKECLHCRNKEYSENLSKNNKIDPNKYKDSLKSKEKPNKNRNIALTVIAIAVSIIALVTIKNEYEKQQAYNMANKIFFGTDDPDVIEKETKKMITEAHRSMRQMNDALKNTNDMFYKNMENINKNNYKEKQ